MPALERKPHESRLLLPGKLPELFPFGISDAIWAISYSTIVNLRRWTLRNTQKQFIFFNTNTNQQLNIKLFAETSSREVSMTGCEQKASAYNAYLLLSSYLRTPSVSSWGTSGILHAQTLPENRNRSKIVLMQSAIHLAAKGQSEASSPCLGLK